MSDSHDPLAYAEQMDFLRDSIAALADEAIAVFEADFPQFFAREVRRRFLDAPDFARSLDDAKLKALKEAIAARSQAAGAAIVEKLRDRDLWLSGTQVAEPAGKSFEDNPALWDVVASICEPLGDFLAEQGFPPTAGGEGGGGPYGLRYREPKRFVSGRYLPSIAEQYWRRIAELREVEGRVRELEREREQAELLARWNRF